MQAGLKPPGSEASAVLQCLPQLEYVLLFSAEKGSSGSFPCPDIKPSSNATVLPMTPTHLGVRKISFALQSLTGNFISPNKVLEHSGIHIHHFAMPAHKL